MTGKHNAKYKAIRVQGSDDDLTKALNEAAKDGWELAQLLGNTSNNSAADNAWLAILRRSHGS